MAKQRKHRQTKKQATCSSYVFFVFLLFALFCLVLLLNGKKNSDLTHVRYYAEIQKQAQAHHLDPALVAAVMRQESKFDPQAVSHVGAKGLMQIMPSTAPDIARMAKRKISKDDLFDPATNILYGTTYLRYLLDRFQNETATALAAYNAGPNAVSAWLKDSSYSSDGKTLHTIPYAETRNYVKKVLDYYKEYR